MPTHAMKLHERDTQGTGWSSCMGPARDLLCQTESLYGERLIASSRACHAPLRARQLRVERQVLTLKHSSPLPERVASLPRLLSPLPPPRPD